MDLHILEAYKERKWLGSSSWRMLFSPWRKHIPDTSRKRRSILPVMNCSDTPGYAICCDFKHVNKEKQSFAKLDLLACVQGLQRVDGNWAKARTQWREGVPSGAYVYVGVSGAQVHTMPPYQLHDLWHIHASTHLLFSVTQTSFKTLNKHQWWRKKERSLRQDTWILIYYETLLPPA